MDEWAASSTAWTCFDDHRLAKHTLLHLQLVMENQQPFQFLVSYSWNTTDIRRNPAGLPTRKRPIGVVITPTKGLANNIVCLFLVFNSLAWLSRFLNFQNWISPLSQTATKPWVKHERLEPIWQIWLRRVLNGRSYVWTGALTRQRVEGYNRESDLPSCSRALMRSTWSICGVFHSVLHLQPFGPPYDCLGGIIRTGLGVTVLLKWWESESLL